MVASIKYYISISDTFDIVVGFGLVFASVVPVGMVVARLLNLL